MTPHKRSHNPSHKSDPPTPIMAQPIAAGFLLAGPHQLIVPGPRRRPQGHPNPDPGKRALGGIVLVEVEND